MALYCQVKVSVGTTGLVLGPFSMTFALRLLADEALKFWPAEEDFESSGRTVRQMSRQVGVGSGCLLTFQRMAKSVSKTRSIFTFIHVYSKGWNVSKYEIGELLGSTQRIVIDDYELAHCRRPLHAARGLRLAGHRSSVFRTFK